jgi:SAM-dependent methyltransferase
MRQDPDRTTWKRLSEAADFQGARVLEVGCGDARVTAMYAHAASPAVGLEPEAGPLAEAAGKVPRAVFVRGSGMALPFRPASFDIILFTLSLHHNPDPRTALSEAAAAARRDGRVLALEPLPEGEIQLLCGFLENEDHRLEAAERALREAPLEILGRKVFRTRWLFRDAREAIDYAFAYFGRPRDETRASAMLDFLGPKTGDAPLVLSDTLVLTSLAPPARG